MLLRGLVRDGRIVRLRLMIGDLPGQLARVAGLIGKAGGNIVEVQHQRLFGSVVAKRTELDVTVETRGRDHVRELVAALSAEGFKVRVLEGRGRVSSLPGARHPVRIMVFWTAASSGSCRAAGTGGPKT